MHPPKKYIPPLALSPYSSRLLILPPFLKKSGVGFLLVLLHLSLFILSFLFLLTPFFKAFAFAVALVSATDTVSVSASG